jgi:hypothetical protein
MRHKRTVGVVALAAALAGISAFALASSEEGSGGYAYAGIPPENLADERGAIERFCPEEPPCHIVETGADSEAAGGATRVGQDLIAAGRPAHACPAAAAVYEQAGDPVDAFIGPCPSRDAAQRIASAAPPPPADPEAEAARAVSGDPEVN